MRQNVIHLERFYASRLGQAAQSMAARRVNTIWPDLTGKDILGYGYAYPHVASYVPHAKRVALAMPGGQGALAHTSKRGVISCLTQDDLLPFADAEFDNVLLAHAIEETDNLQTFLAELWRVTKPEGRILVIASNRAGLWARSDKSPIGAGRPFSRTQLRGLLRDVGFEPTFWAGALYAPPLKPFTGDTFLSAFERFGETVWPSFSGLILVEAVKRLYAEPTGHKARKASRPVFGTAPIGNTTQRQQND